MLRRIAGGGARHPREPRNLLTMEAVGGLFTTEVYVVKQATADYRLDVEAMPTIPYCDTTTDGSLTLTLLGTTADGSKVVRNPATAGTYTWLVSYVDTAGGSHSDSGTVAITN